MAVERQQTPAAARAQQQQPSGPAQGVLVRVGRGDGDRSGARRTISRAQLGLVGTLGPLGIAFLALAALPNRSFDFGRVLGPEAATMLMLVALTAAVLFLFPGTASATEGRQRWTSQPASFLGPFEPGVGLPGARELVRRQAERSGSAAFVLELSRRGLTLAPGGRGAPQSVRLSWREIRSIDVVRGEQAGVQITTLAGQRAVFAVDPDRGFERTLAALGAEIVSVVATDPGTAPRTVPAPVGDCAPASTAAVSSSAPFVVDGEAPVASCAAA